LTRPPDRAPQRLLRADTTPNARGPSTPEVRPILRRLPSSIVVTFSLTGSSSVLYRISQD
ncbi:MAG TPA: hypothetical protein VN444_03755, partial [Verrucomicrobiae bacterium]|nr:hypothetical protein [Verrucomicrobiae bacterium]